MLRRAMITNIIALILLMLLAGCENNIENKSIAYGIEIKDGIAYLYDSNTKLTGKLVMFYQDKDDTFSGCTDESLALMGINIGNNNPFIGAKSSLLSWLSNEKKQICLEESFKDGKRDGHTVEYGEDGRKKFDINFLDGKKDGMAIWYCQANDQNICQLTNYRNGKKFGLEKIWDEYGNQTSRKSNILPEAPFASAKPFDVMEISHDKMSDLTWVNHRFYFDHTSPIELYISKTDDSVWLRIKYSYTGSELLSTESLIILANDKRFILDAVSFKSRYIADQVVESYDKMALDNDLEIIKSIINSNESIIRFKGSSNYYDYYITDNERKALGETLKAYENYGGEI